MNSEQLAQAQARFAAAAAALDAAALEEYEQAREALYGLQLRHCRTAHQVAAVALTMLGHDRDTAYQAMPEMNQRTVRRITAELPELAPQDSKRAALKDTVRRYTSFLSLKTPIPPNCPPLPEELAQVKEAAERAGVSPVKALEAVGRYGNPIEVVLRRLNDLRTLGEYVQLKSRTGLFVHLMRNNKEVVLPEAVQAQREQAQQPKAEPLQVGDTLAYYGETARVTELLRTACLVETASGDAYRLQIEVAQRLRDLPAPQLVEKPTVQAPKPVEPRCPDNVIQGLLNELKRKLGKGMTSYVTTL